jgi:hypothetical protein
LLAFTTEMATVHSFDIGGLPWSIATT